MFTLDVKQQEDNNDDEIMLHSFRKDDFISLTLLHSEKPNFGLSECTSVQQWQNFIYQFTGRMYIKI